MDKTFKRANFPGNDLLISIRSVVLPVMAKIAQSLKGDFVHIKVANPGGSGFRPTLPTIKYSMKMIKLFHFHRILKINEIKNSKLV